MLSIGVVGATGMVGKEFIQLLEQRRFPIEHLRLFASQDSRGSKISFRGDQIEVQTLSEGCFKGLDVVFFSSGDYTFSVYGEDKNGMRSSPFTFSISITSGALTRISGIFIAPTIAVDKSEVKKGDNIVIFGQSSPLSEIIINVNSENEFFEKTPSDKDGIYLRNFSITF
jgi:hypothetical protein